MGKRVLIGIFIFFACTAAAWAGQGAYDVNSFSLHSLSIDTSSGSEILTFDVAARKTASYETPLNIQKATEKAIEYFFIGLVIPDDAFWVNLNPEGMTKIMEAGLAETDLGKVMLAADLRLKKDTCELTNPQRSKVGRTYWDSLYAKADALGIVDQIPVYNRVWIIPGAVRLIQSSDQITIAHSALQVCFEAEVYSDHSRSVDAKTKELQEYAGRLMRELIIPELNKKVNESRSYAALRQVYNALILARAYKQKEGPRTARGFRMMDARTVLADVEKSLPLDKDTIYKDYLKSLRNGEYNFQEDVSGRLNFYMEVITRQYMSGGIDLRNIKMDDDGARRSRPEGPSVEATANYSFAISFSESAVRPLAAVKDQIAQRFNAYNQARSQQSVLSSENLPPVEPVSDGSRILPYGRNLEIMLRHL